MKIELAPANPPRISVVVPNYNGGRTIGQTLQSLADQRYPDLEIIVVDGGSSDNSVEVIRHFKPILAWWVSEKDRGQAHAINKGFARATGEVLNWLCSDDLLEPGALLAVGEAFAATPEADVVCGSCKTVFLDSRAADSIHSPCAQAIADLPYGNAVAQPSTFYRRRLLDRPMPLLEDLHYVFDFELWTYFNARGARWKIIPDVLSVNQMSSANKTTTGGVRITYELERVYNAYVHQFIPLTFWQRHLRYPLLRLMKRHPGLAWKWFGGPVYKCSTFVLGIFYGLRRVRRMNWVDYA